MYITALYHLRSVADPEGQIRPCPPPKLTMEFGPLGGRKRNDSIANLSILAPPYRRRLRIWPPPTEKYHIKTLKRSMTKKRSSEILGDR